MKVLRTLLLCFTYFGVGSTAHAAVVSLEPGFYVSGELEIVRTLSGSNVLSLSFSQNAVPYDSNPLIVLYSDATQILAPTEMVVVLGRWTSYLRDPTNSFLTFGGNDSTTFNFAQLSERGGNSLSFLIGPFDQQILDGASLPNVEVFVGFQSLENLAFTSGSGPRIVTENVSVGFVPEPTTTGLLLIAGFGIAARRRRPESRSRTSRGWQPPLAPLSAESCVVSSFSSRFHIGPR